MSRPKARRAGSSPTRWTWVLTLRLRWSTSWASWRRSRSRRRLARAERRTLALQLALDSSLLREKELAQELAMAEHRLQEMADSRVFRTGSPVLPPMVVPQVPPEDPTDRLRRLLGA